MTKQCQWCYSTAVWGIAHYSGGEYGLCQRHYDELEKERRALA